MLAFSISQIVLLHFNIVRAIFRIFVHLRICQECSHWHWRLHFESVHIDTQTLINILPFFYRISSLPMNLTPERIPLQNTSHFTSNMTNNHVTASIVNTTPMPPGRYLKPRGNGSSPLGTASIIHLCCKLKLLLLFVLQM